MIRFANGGRLVQSCDELPALENAKRLYLDFETTSGDFRKDSLNPWQNCSIAGACVTVDDAEGAWYVPVGHADERWNLPRENVLRWLTQVVGSADEWVNHNIKYDAHVAAREGVQFAGRLVDTLTGSKIIDSDRVMRGGYGLSTLSESWLGYDISPLEKRVKAYLFGLSRCKDYGEVPADILGEYGCGDVFSTRMLLNYVETRMPEQCKAVWATEVDLTSALFDMEETGLRVDAQELKIKEFQLLHELLAIEEKLHATFGTLIRPHVNDDCFDLLCNRYGLPVLGWTNEEKQNEEHNPSFTADVLGRYLRHPLVATDPELTNAVNLMLRYRKRNTLLTLFVRVLQDLAVDGRVHSQYNQAVRTGRMSARKPNSQQQSEESKALIHPDDGQVFISADSSQIEFRLIVHLIRDHWAIKAYNEDPDTDFHQWVAEMCGVPRRPAKNINFMMAFGGGKKRAEKMLAADMGLVGQLMNTVDELVAAGEVPEEQRAVVFNALARRRASAVYRKYHSTLPGIKRTSWRASEKLKARGYVFNMHGRRRHLPKNVSFRAFSSVVQSDAADVMKEQAVATAPRFNSVVRSLGIRQAAIVHDEFLFLADEAVGRDPAVLAYLVRELEKSRIEYRVPIRVNIGVADGSWAKAGDKQARVQVDRALPDPVSGRG